MSSHLRRVNVNHSQQIREALLKVESQSGHDLELLREEDFKQLRERATNLMADPSSNMNSNARFLENFSDHVNIRWANYYLAYDKLRTMYKDLKVKHKNIKGVDGDNCDNFNKLVEEGDLKPNNSYSNGNGSKRLSMEIQQGDERLIPSKKGSMVTLCCTGKDTDVEDDLTFETFEESFKESIENVVSYLKFMLVTMLGELNSVKKNLDKLNSQRNSAQSSSHVPCFRESLDSIPSMTKKDFFIHFNTSELNDLPTMLEFMLSCYSLCNQFDNFLDLNDYAINKIAKKLQSLYSIIHRNDGSKDDLSGDAFATWKKYKSYDVYTSKFQVLKDNINDMKMKIMTMYKASSVSSDPMLEFDSCVLFSEASYSFADSLKKAEISFGFRIGFCIFFTLLAVICKNLSRADILFWETPGMLLYAYVVTLVVCKLVWGINLYFFDRFNIDYVHCLGFTKNQPRVNSFKLMSSSLTLLSWLYTQFFVYYILAGVFDYRSDTMEGFTFFPLFSVVTYVTFNFYKVWGQGNDHYNFLTFVDRKKLLDLLMSGFCNLNPSDATADSSADRSTAAIKRSFVLRHMVTRGTTNGIKPKVLKNTKKGSGFRIQQFFFETMTSFTVLFSNSVLILCWFISGDVSDYDKDQDTVFHFGGGPDGCACQSEAVNVTRAVVVALLLLAAVLNNVSNALKSSRIGGKAKYSLRCLKYVFSIVFLCYGMVQSDYESISTFLWILAIGIWLEDVFFDWGLFRILPFLKITGTDDNYFLRGKRIYPSTLFYYIAIILDLPLRYLWLVTLLPNLQTFFGADAGYWILLSAPLEMLRRAIWLQIKTENDQVQISSFVFDSTFSLDESADQGDQVKIGGQDRTDSDK